MIQNDAVRFLDSNENEEALKVLVKRMHELDRVTGEYPKRDRERMIEFAGRRWAIDIISGWITDLFAISRGEWEHMYSKREDNDVNDYDEY
jgi:hypothetical protein